MPSLSTEELEEPIMAEELGRPWPIPNLRKFPVPTFLRQLITGCFF